ncbi:MAG: DUF21 domain-containing protein [Pirellulaceae bacterium]|jgi:putative hemolysin|nr:DUF21 domain-containing protein [Pirellulaceae bacterium]
MELFYKLAPFLAAMLVLLVGSAFFSSSEAALFSLRPTDRRKMQRGTRRERLAVKLLDESELLLATILFCNLVINLAFFSLGAICSMRIEGSGDWLAAGFVIGTLLMVVVFGEMIPKTLGVLAPVRLARLVAEPLSLLTRLLGRIEPAVLSVNRVAQRIFWPGLRREAALEVGDIERAIEISGADASLIRHEQAVLANIVQLSEIRVDEWMRPRTQFDPFRPPVSLADLKGTVPKGGYLFITESNNDEIERAIRLDNCFELPNEHLERLGEPVLYLPWCATVADALQGMSARDREVTVIVNELGETIGLLTIEDILETIFTYSPSRSRMLLNRNPLHPIEEGRWIVAGIMSLRQLARRLDVDIPRTHSITVAGVIQEEMQRLAETGDECIWGPFHFRVIEVGERGNIVVELQLVPYREEGS